MNRYCKRRDKVCGRLQRALAVLIVMIKTVLIKDTKTAGMADSRVQYLHNSLLKKVECIGYSKITANQSYKRREKHIYGRGNKLVLQIYYTPHKLICHI